MKIVIKKRHQIALMPLFNFKCVQSLHDGRNQRYLDTAHCTDFHFLVVEGEGFVTQFFEFERVVARGQFHFEATVGVGRGTLVGRWDGY